MKLRKGRVALVIFAALAVWLAGSLLITWALLSKYTYSMERISPSGVVEQLYQPGEKEDRDTASRLTLLLTLGTIAGLVTVLVVYSRPGRWFRPADVDLPDQSGETGS
jgi:hypothetical protein